MVLANLGAVLGAVRFASQAGFQTTLVCILLAARRLSLMLASPWILQIATRDSGTYRKMVSVIEQLRARDARLIVMVNEGDPLLTSPGAKGCRFIEVRQEPFCCVDRFSKRR
jgi:hypothetical protein